MESTNEAKLAQIREIVELRTSDAEKVRQIRRLLGLTEWTDTGSGPGYPGGGEYFD